MKRLWILFSLLFAFAAQAHVGSPNVFFDGMVGAYPARVTIQMPTVVPGRAEISVRVATTEPVEVSFAPVFTETAISNTPPPDIGRLVRGESNLYSGGLWLMRFGAYSVDVHIKGASGEGMAQIPVTSVAFKQLPMPGLLGKILLCMVAVLVIGGIGIAAAAGREAALPAGEVAGKIARWKGIFSGGAMASICILALVGGKYWWNGEEHAFRGRLLKGPWPDIATKVHVGGGQRILQIEVGKKFFKHNDDAPLIPDHGKLMHLFLVREGSRDAFAHLHPIHKKDHIYEVAVPPLPEGRYDIFCDVTFEGGASSTATNSVVLPAIPDSTIASTNTLEQDPDDSWAIGVVPDDAATFRLPDGSKVEWKHDGPLRINRDASLHFSVTDASGTPVDLEPYMGMLSHAAVLRDDNAVFSHLHPSGNYSMAAQMFFENKESGGSTNGMGDMAGMDHSKMHHMHMGGGTSGVYLPYEFPEPGNYRVWVQFKAGGKVVTAVFDAKVD